MQTNEEKQIHVEDNTSEKKQVYITPILVNYGDLATITLGNPGLGSDGIGAPGGS